MGKQPLLMRTGVLTSYAQLCRRHDVDALALVRGVGLPAEVLTNPDLYIRREVAAALLQAAAEAADSPSFAMDLVDLQELNAVGAIAYLPFQGATIREGLELGAQVLGYHVQGVTLTVRDIDGRLSVVETEFGIPLEPGFRQAVEMSFWRTGVLLRALFGDAYTPVEHWFGYPPPTDPARFDARFDAPICWGKPSTGHGYVFPTELLSLRPQGQPDVRDFLVRFLEQASVTTVEATATTQAREVIRSFIGRSRSTLETVAAAMGTYPRELQRQLGESGASFGELRDSVHLDYACDALRRPEVSMTVIALELGYSESSAFSRAFKQWTGSSPTAWRRQALRNGSA